MWSRKALCQQADTSWIVLLCCLRANGDLREAVTDAAPAQATLQLGWRPEEGLVGKEWSPGPRVGREVPHVDYRGRSRPRGMGGLGNP